MHQIKALIDVLKRHHVSDHRIYLDFSIHVPIYDLRHIGTTARAAKGRAAPNATRHQLEGAGGDFRACWCNTNDDALPPTLMRAFQRLTHNRDIAGRIEGVISAAAGQLNKVAKGKAALLSHLKRWKWLCGKNL